IRARSPVRNHPSGVKTSASASGRSQYPEKRLGPRAPTSPTSPRGPSRPPSAAPLDVQRRLPHRARLAKGVGGGDQREGGRGLRQAVALLEEQATVAESLDDHQRAGRTAAGKPDAPQGGPPERLGMQG